MELYLVRHGIAVDIGEYKVKTDEDRFLSSKGKKRTAQTAKALAVLKVIPAIILTSPLARALQTARIITESVSPRPRLVESEYLAPSARLASALNGIRALQAASVMLVGHMPQLSRLASALLAGDDRIVSVDFDKSGVCCIACAGKPGKSTAQLRWLLTSDQCRCIARCK